MHQDLKCQLSKIMHRLSKRFQLSFSVCGDVDNISLAGICP